MFVKGIPHTVYRNTPDQAGGNQLQVGDQARGHQNGANVGAITKFEQSRNQADNQCAEQFKRIVVLGIGDIPDKESKIQGQCQQYEKCK